MSWIIFQIKHSLGMLVYTDNISDALRKQHRSSSNMCIQTSVWWNSFLRIFGQGLDWVQIWWMNSLCNSPDITTFCLRSDEFPFSLPLICRTFAVKWCIGLSSNLADDVVRSQSRLYFGHTPLNLCYLLAFYWWLYHRIHAIPKKYYATLKIIGHFVEL